MAPRLEAIVKPALLVWARETAGYSAEEAASKLHVKLERFSAWEEGRARPTVNQLRELARVYRRPLAVFYLPEPPKAFQALRDYRRLPGSQAGTESPGLLFEIRRAHHRRAIALELFEELQISPPVFELRIDLTEDPEEVAVRLRRSLGVSEAEQHKPQDPYAVLRRWREATESLGTLVFTATEVDSEEARAFSLADERLPAIVVNIKDSPKARVFSMLHELAHVALRRGGLCDLSDLTGPHGEEQQVEVFCNAVAGATLVPMGQLLAHEMVSKTPRGADWSDQAIDALSDDFSVSREVVLRRLLKADRISVVFFRKKRKQYLREYHSLRRKKGFAPPSRLVVSRSGPSFVRLVLSAYYQERITAADVSDYLETKLKHMPEVESAVMGHAVEFGATG